MRFDPAGDHRIVVMVARDPACELRLTADPRHVDLAAVTAALRTG